MTATDLIAIIGALAWTPPVISWLRSQLTRPEIRVFTHVTPEIGYTAHGPIFNLRLALTATHRDLVVTGMRVRITHESGEQREFSWRGITQRMGTMGNQQMGAVNFHKETTVLAMKVSTTDVEERFVRFLDVEFLDTRSELSDAAIKRLAYCQQTSTPLVPGFTESTEVIDLHNFVKQSLFWKTGGYKAKFLLDSPNSFNIKDDEYAFTLTLPQVEKLQNNYNFVPQAFESELVPAPVDLVPAPITWNWVYPQMRSTEL